MKYSHAFDFAYEVESDEEDASDVTPGMMRRALIERAARLPDAEIKEACDKFDTCEDIEKTKPTNPLHEIRIMLGGAAFHFGDGNLTDGQDLLDEAIESFEALFPDPNG